MTTTVELAVKGMTCTGCEERIQGAVGEVEGVEAVDADHQEGTVSVTLERENTATDEVRAAIDGLGYRHRHRVKTGLYTAMALASGPAAGRLKASEHMTKQEGDV